MQDFAFIAYRRRKTTLSFVYWMLGLVVFHAAIFNPIYLWITSDVLLSETVLSLILNIISDLYNYLFYWVGFAFLIFSVTRFSYTGSIRVGGIFLLGMALRYLLDMLGGYLIMGFPTVDDILFELLYVGINLIFDLALVLVAFMITYAVTARRKFDLFQTSKKTAFLAWMPPKSFFALGNPLLKSSFLSCSVLGGVRILYRIYYDVALIGAPTGLVDLLWMITYYVSDLAIIVVGYIIIQLFLTKLYMNELRSQELYFKTDDAPDGV